MKSYLDLIPRSAKVHRKQNLLTLICIILAVFLVTVIFSITDVWLTSEKEASIKKHGNYHIILNDVSEDTAELIRQRDGVTASSQYGNINNDAAEDYYINGKKAVLFGAEKSYVSDIRNFPIDGDYPQSEREIMLSTAAKDLCGLNIGDSVTINTPADDFSYTISGFCDDSVETKDRSGTIYAYMNMETFTTVSNINGKTYNPQYYIQFGKSTKLKKTIAEIKEQYNLSDTNVEENLRILGISGQSTKQQMTGLYPTTAAMFIFILIAGVLMISSCMNSNVAQRTKFFGMLRCIGASKKQIIRFVRLEALNWCKTAIPIGCALGTLVTWILCEILRYLIGGEFSEITFKFSIIGVVCGVAVGFIMVLLAAHSPAKRAAKVSPVAAVLGNTDEAKGISHAANTRLFKVETALCINHATLSKKNFVLMTLSFAFTILLFFSFFAVLDFVHALVPTSEDLTSDFAVTSANFANDLDRSMKSQMEQIEGVDKVFSNSFALGTSAEINGTKINIDLMSYDTYLLEWGNKTLIAGDISKVYGNSHYALASFNSESRLNIGDKIKIGDDELEIAAVSSQSIMGGSKPIVCCYEETFTRITGEENYTLLNVMFNKDATDQTVKELEFIVGDNEFVDRREENKSINSSFWVFHIAAYGFLAIIALITIFNIMNSISMSVSARIKQYGAMRAVGMSINQLIKMIAAEAITYAVCELVLGCASGLYMHYLITKKLIIEHFGGIWHIPINPIVIILMIIILSCIAAIYAPSKRIKRMAITDTIQAQ